MSESIPMVRAVLPLGSSAPGRAVMLMLLSMALLTCNDAAMKWLGERYPVGQVMALRALCALVPLSLFVAFGGGLRTLRIRDWRNQLLRAALAVGSTFAFVTGLTLLPLADAIAITFLGPVFITLLAPAFLRERVGWRRWTAVGLGFVGAWVMARPGVGPFGWAMLIPLAAALFGAVRDIVTRRMSVTEHSNATTTFTTVAVGLAGLASLPVGIVLPEVAWVRPAMSDLPFFLLTGILLGSAHWCMIDAFRLGEAALLAPFKYSSFVWAVALGFAIWGHWPDYRTFIGAAVIAGSGLYILHRELSRRGSPSR